LIVPSEAGFAAIFSWYMAAVKVAVQVVISVVAITVWLADPPSLQEAKVGATVTMKSLDRDQARPLPVLQSGGG
jgi:hypothetical protein